MHLVEHRIGGNMWLVACDCGNQKVISPRDVRSGHTKSCGCMSGKWRGEKTKTHGLTETKEYRIWCHMLARCACKTDKKYPYYGARGITVCARWATSFTAFLHDMGACPTQWHSIDRIDNDKGYSPDNCRWADAKVQSQNRRYLKKVKVLGVEMLAIEAERKLNAGGNAIRQRATRTGETLQQAAEHFEKRYLGMILMQNSPRIQ